MEFSEVRIAPVLCDMRATGVGRICLIIPRDGTASPAVLARLDRGRA